MAEKLFYHDINLLDVGQLVRARKQNVTTAEQTALGATLGLANEGLFIWNTDEKKGYTWDGVKFVAEAVEIAGDVIFKGIIDASLPLNDAGQPQPIEAISGYEYVVGTAGSLSLSGVTFSPSNLVEVGDRVLFTSPTQAYVQQRNDVQASETVLGNIRLATQTEVNAGTDAVEAVTPLTLQGKLVAQKYTKQYNASVNLSAGVAANVVHGLGLLDKDAFTVNVIHNGSVISVDVDSVDANAITLTSLLPLTGVKVTVIGASAT